MQRLFDEIEAFEKPTIAAVNGFALGGGCELAMSCDIRIAAEQRPVRAAGDDLSVLPGAGGTQRLARLVGTGRAIELILTGRFVDAAEAHRHRAGHLGGPGRRADRRGRAGWPGRSWPRGRWRCGWPSW